MISKWNCTESKPEGKTSDRASMQPHWWRAARAFFTACEPISYKMPMARSKTPRAFQHAYLKSTGRVKYVAVSDNDALDAFKRLSDQEGIMPALEPAHALSYAFKLAKRYPTSDSIIVNLSGRGDKDVEIVARHFPQ